MKKIYFFFFVANVLLAVCGLFGRAFADQISILSANPVDGTSSVAINTVITVKYNDSAMDPVSIGAGSATTNSAGTFTVSYADGGTTAYLEGNIIVVGGAAKFTPIANLTASTLYTCVMATGTTNLSGGSSANGISFSFTTGTNSDSSNGGVWYTDPLNNATGVDISKLFYVVFKERQDATTVGTSTITLSSDSGTVSGDVNYYDYGDNYTGTPTATLKTTSNLSYSTLYTVTVGGITDMAGNNAGTSTYTFTTVSAPSSGGEEPVKPKPLQVTEIRINQNLDKIQIKFNYFLNGDYLRIIEIKDCELKDSSGNEKAFGSLELDGNTVTLFLVEKLAQNSDYTLTIKGGNEGPVAADAGGEVLAEDYIFKFNTGSAENGGKGIRHKRHNKN